MDRVQRSAGSGQWIVNSGHWTVDSEHKKAESKKSTAESRQLGLVTDKVPPKLLGLAWPKPVRTPIGI